MAITGLPVLFLLAARVAIVVSAENADGQPTLRYAERDGERVAQVLGELGDFAQIVRLRQPNLRMLEQTLDAAEGRSAGDPSLEIFIYYSGHADESGLLLGSERLTYPALRTRLERSRAAVRVAFLDACHTGSLVRPKGGAPAPGFALAAIESPKVHGAAILAASSSQELAQESSAIEGSFFTHHLLSALRGAGDRDGNGMVTIAEAYQYAYDRTLSATWPSLLGPQHPAYEYQLSGTGDLVLTRLGQGRQALSFPMGSGAAYVVSSRRGDVVAEVSPHPKHRVRLILQPGPYLVAAREGERVRSTEISLDERGQDVAVEQGQWRDVPAELAYAKGLSPEPRNELFADVALTGLGPGVLGLSPEIGLGYFRRFVHWNLGPRLGYSKTEGTVEGVPYRLTRLSAMAYLMRRFPLRFVEAEVGLGLGASFIGEGYGPRDLKGNAPQDRYGRAPAGALALAVDVPVTHWLIVRLHWGAGMEMIWLADHFRFSPELRSSLALAFRL